MTIKNETQAKPTLEDKIARLKEIQVLIETKQVSLSASIPLVEEAYKIKKEIEIQLSEIESKLVQLEDGEINENSNNAEI